MAVSRVGKLKNSITIQSLSQGADGYGGFSAASYTDVITAFAKITPKSGTQIFNDKSGRQVENPHTHEFMIRYRSGITTAQRIKFGSRLFDIIQINDENDNNNYITIKAKENVGIA